MKRSAFTLVILVISLTLMMGTGCKKKTQPIARGPVSQPAPVDKPAERAAMPTIEISASPSTVKRGADTTITWNSSNADSVTIDGGIGNVAASGSIQVNPLESTTYTATAHGSGGEAKASTRITVVRGDDKPAVKMTDIEALRKAIADGLIKPVFFAYDMAELGAESRATLESNAKYFREYPDARIIIEGHCDERGTEEYNLALGDRRAQVTRSYLVELGISADRLEPVSFGEERPFVQGSTEAAWSQNRRAHFSIR